MRMYKHALPNDRPLVIYAKVRTQDTVSMHTRKHDHAAAFTQVNKQIRTAMLAFYSTMYFSVNNWALPKVWLQELSVDQIDLLSKLEVERTGSMGPVNDPEDRRSVDEHLAAIYREQIRLLEFMEPRVVEIVQTFTGGRMMWLKGRSGLDLSSRPEYSIEDGG
ncbi:hypothetical protein LTR95_007128 [Oleoguttula sp. CCFEE 5521]